MPRHDPSCACAVFAALLTAGVPANSAPGHTGPTGIKVHSQFHGQIFGFDIDQNGSEGVLSEAKLLNNGAVLAAAETFDQSTGKILKVVQKIRGKDDFVTLGIVGPSIGLVEREHVKNIYVSKRIYNEINPLTANAFTGTWPAPLTTEHIIRAVSRIQGAGTTAFYGIHNVGAGDGFVIGANVANATFGPLIKLTDPVFATCCGAALGYDSTSNNAVLASATGAVGGPPPIIALANLSTGQVTEFNGIPGPPPYRQGFVNGLAVDSEDEIACTTTELDFRVEFYNLKTQSGFAVVLPGATGQLQSGSDVEFDPLNKLFFVAQSSSSTAAGSSIQIYDTKGNLVESLNGFNFSNAGNVIGTHIALNPANRTGYVDGPDANVADIEQFRY